MDKDSITCEIIRDNNRMTRPNQRSPMSWLVWLAACLVGAVVGPRGVSADNLRSQLNSYNALDQLSGCPDLFAMPCETLGLQS